jgi:hypothetical protein
MSPDSKSLPSPSPLVEIEDPAGVLWEVGITGKIHERTCPGLIASSASHRPIIDADASLRRA